MTLWTILDTAEDWIPSSISLFLRVLTKLQTPYFLARGLQFCPFTFSKIERQVFLNVLQANRWTGPDKRVSDI